jgi:hypothetical protein
MYFDIRKETERELEKIEEILQFTKGNGLVIAVDSNSRSVAWYDSQTNQRGKIMEEYIVSKILNISQTNQRGKKWKNIT